MQISQSSLAPDGSWTELGGALAGPATFVLAFGPRARLSDPLTWETLRLRHPQARIVQLSTAGSFAENLADDHDLVCTALRLEKSRLCCASARLEDFPDLPALARSLAAGLDQPDLRHVLVFSDGGRVNGSSLAAALNQSLPTGVTVSGGLAGYGTLFQQTLVGLDAPPRPGLIVAAGLCGDSLRIGFGSAGGWTSFGPSRTVTRSEGNILHALDGRPALSLYKEYLGFEAASLPAAALRFPLHVVADPAAPGVVRSILSLDEQAGSMTFAGDIPDGASARFMRASYEEIIGGAESAARYAAATPAEWVLCVSCVGRRIVLGHRTEEEIEGVRAAFGSGPVISGFYSYGELAPTGEAGACQLHNQTMTVTAIAEA